MLRQRGMSQAQAAREVHISLSSAEGKEKGMRDNGQSFVARREQRQIPNQPLPFEKLCDEAKRAWGDFEYFRLRYFGHLSTPWQIATAELIVRLLETPDDEYVVENVAPGTGKTTLCHDIAAWVTVRNRAIRGLFGSRVQANADRMSNRLRRSFERTTPARAKQADKDRGLAVDALACLAVEFGTFRPEAAETWRAGEFVVAQPGGDLITNKEPTWSAYGMDGGVLGNRFEIIFWDDVVDRKTVRTAEAVESQRIWWDDEGESRLETGGVLFLVGQRMASEDLYRYCLDKRLAPDDFEPEPEDEDEVEVGEPMYRHIVYKAHDTERCEGVHGADAAPWPDGCLLDPKRLPWRKLRGRMGNGRNFSVLYQQEDADPTSGLVNPIWISGGRGSDGVDHPGCWDMHRDRLDIPRGLSGELISIATADPSPTKYWAVEWWLYHPDSEQRFLIDLERGVMEAPDFLDWNYNEARFTGLMEEWQTTSEDKGVPITAWIVEANAAQRFILQYDHARRWQALHSVDVIPHQTHVNKSDPNFGVETIAPHFQYGRVRLPGKPSSYGRLASMRLIAEAERWPNGATDCVMAYWFLEWNLPQLYAPASTSAAENQMWVPSWMQKAS